MAPVTEFTEWVIERDNGVDLAFDGIVLAQASSERSNAPRWTEIRIYQTATDRFVCEVIGATRVQGEFNRRRANVYDTAKELRDSLKQRNSEGVVYMTYLSLDVLDEAAEKCPEIKEVMVEHV